MQNFGNTVTLAWLLRSSFNNGMPSLPSKTTFPFYKSAKAKVSQPLVHKEKQFFFYLNKIRQEHCTRQGKEENDMCFKEITEDDVKNELEVRLGARKPVKRLL